nr:unnamed protein product [Digitaria exilis]
MANRSSSARRKSSGTYGPYSGHAGIVRSLSTLVTNAGKNGPSLRVPVQDGGRIVGFFGRSGSLLDAVGW